MVSALNLLASVAYALGLFTAWQDRSFRPLLLLVAGSGAMLGQPLWARLFGNATSLSGSALQVGHLYSLPYAAIYVGGALLALPPVAVIYGLRHNWWQQHYAAGWVFYLLFVLFFLILDTFGLDNNIAIYARPQLERVMLLASVLQVLLLAGVSFGLLYSFVATRHYALRIALLPLLASGLAATFLFNGILASPFWVASFIQQQSSRTGSALPDQLVLVGAIIAIALILWGIHLLASSLHEGRRQRLQWR
ncbi:MAG: hypothetical protein H0X37_17065 [Herpetosiphonaceae bacterium]|nr:hypothetical protein [Herpetosiphonaceae bacterium]